MGAQSGSSASRSAGAGRHASALRFYEEAGVLPPPARTRRVIEAGLACGCARVDDCVLVGDALDGQG